MTTTADTLVPDQLWQAIQPLLPLSQAASAAGPASTTAPPWPASSISYAPASPGGCHPHSSLAAAAQSPAGGGYGTGSAPACGSASTTCCWPSSAARADS